MGAAMLRCARKFKFTRDAAQLTREILNVEKATKVVLDLETFYWGNCKNIAVIAITTYGKIWCKGRFHILAQSYKD